MHYILTSVWHNFTLVWHNALHFDISLTWFDISSIKCTTFWHHYDTMRYSLTQSNNFILILKTRTRIKPGWFPFHITLRLTTWHIALMLCLYVELSDQLMTTWHCSALYLNISKYDTGVRLVSGINGGRDMGLPEQRRGLLSPCYLKKNKFRRKMNTLDTIWEIHHDTGDWSLV